MFDICVYERGANVGNFFQTDDASRSIGEFINKSGLGKTAEFAVVNGEVLTREDFDLGIDNFDEEIHIDVIPYEQCGKRKSGKLSYLSVIASVIATEIAIAIPLLIYCRYFWIG